MFLIYTALLLIVCRSTIVYAHTQEFNAIEQKTGKRNFFFFVAIGL